MKILACLLASVLSVSAVTITIDCVWDQPPPSTPPQTIAKFIVYERINGAPVKLGETANGSTLSFRLNSVANNQHVYFVTAVNDSGQESAPSNDATYTPPVGSNPNAPVNFRIFVTFGP